MEHPREGTPLAVAHPRLTALRQVLDPAFEEAGLSPTESSPGAAATYSGTLDGRSVEVVCSVRTNTRYASSSISYRQFSGLNLEITLETPLQTQAVVTPPLGVSLAGADNVCVRGVIRAAELWGDRREQLPRWSLDEPRDTAVRVRAADESWTRQLLTPELRQVLWNLLPPRDLGTIGPVGQWSLAFVPGELRLSLTPEASTLTGPNLTHWLKTAVWLAEQGEVRQPAPYVQRAVPVQELSPTQRRRRAVGVVMIGLACIALIPVLLLAFFGVGYLLVGRWIMVVPIVFAFFFMPYAMYLLVRNKARSVARARQLAKEPHWSQQSAREAG